MANIEDLLAKAESIKQEEEKNDGRNKLRSAFAGMIVGGITGLMIGYSRKWKLFYSIIGGATIGAAVTYVFTPKS
jgi:hypothetical protein